MIRAIQFPYPGTAILAVAVLSLLSCKKEVPPVYDGDNFLFFFTRPADDKIIPVTTNGTPSKTFNFQISFYQRDTLKMNENPDWYLSIQTDGKLLGEDRPISMQIEGNGKEFCVLPDPASIFIPANATAYKLNLKLVRPPISDTGLKVLTLTLKNNGPFKPEKHVWHKLNYYFGNVIEQPFYYSRLMDKYGDFSPAKIYAIQEAVDKKGKAYWEADPNITLLNNRLQNGGQRKIQFDPFSMDELYYFMDLTWELNIPDFKGPVQDAYWAVTDKMIALTKDLIVERRAANQPILDGSGREISFP